MKNTLQLKISQQLTMTPQLQQAIKLLQLSSIELQQEIQTAIETNPMLELSEDNKEYETEDLEYRNYDFTCYERIPINHSFSSQEEYLDYIYQQNNAGETLHEYLLWQLNLSSFSKKDTAIGKAIIDSINEDGYLTASIKEIANSINYQEKIDKDEVEAILHWIQRLDPIGVGARDLRECLLIQLQKIDKYSKELKIARQIISEYFDLLTIKKYQEIKVKGKISTDDLKLALEIIKNLNPRPGKNIGCNTADYIYPDVIVYKLQNTWHVELNQNLLPKFTINQTYAQLIKKNDASSTNNYLREQLQEARWLLKSVQSRNQTLLKVANCIIDYQKEFLEYGEEAMKPMILSDIAKATELHESTVSRVTNQKFIYTPKGVFELKYFFSSHLSTKTGGECSSTAIRALIKKLIAQEITKNPLSDNKIALLLQSEGIKVARRTVAKYREAMNIPSSSERKKLSLTP